MNNSALILFALVILACTGDNTNNIDWPGDSFSLPMPSIGCPDTTYTVFKTGTRIQETESGSASSYQCHLKICPNGRTVVSNFCTHDIHNKVVRGPKYNSWTKGSYCIYKKDECPIGFKEGSLKFDDASSVLMPRGQQSSNGELPDGEYNKNTLIYYCCRVDGSPDDLLTLPTSKPFYLLKMGYRCQRVKNAKVTEEWVSIVTEKTVNSNGKKGLHPHIQISGDYMNVVKLFYCYYEHSAPTKGILGIWLFLLLLFGGGTFIVIGLFGNRCWKTYSNISRYNNHADRVQVEDTAMMPTAPPSPPATTSTFVESSVEKTRKPQTCMAPPTYDEAMAMDIEQRT